MEQFKTFEDLEFKNSDSQFGISGRARLNFKNGYGISVITGFGSYSDESNPYEVAVLFNNELCYNTEITNDVIGWQTSENVTCLMQQIQLL